MIRQIAYATVASLGMTLGFAPTPANAQFNIQIGGGYGNPGIYIGNGPRVAYGGSHLDNHYHVKYRQPFWKEQSFSTPFEARQFADFKASQGFETLVVRHGLHFDVRYRLLHWATYRTVHSHGAAHNLERLLESQGYQAKVVHH